MIPGGLAVSKADDYLPLPSHPPLPPSPLDGEHKQLPQTKTQFNSEYSEHGQVQEFDPSYHLSSLYPIISIHSFPIASTIGI